MDRDKMLKALKLCSIRETEKRCSQGCPYYDDVHCEDTLQKDLIDFLSGKKGEKANDGDHEKERAD